MRSYVWSVPCLFALGALAACSESVGGATPGGSGTGGTGTTTGAGAGGSGTTGSGAGGSGTGGDLFGECPAQTLTARACLVPAGGFVGDPPATLDLVATVAEIGAGEPPFGCWESPATVNRDLTAPGPVWARLEDDMMQEWVVAFSVPTLQAGFNGHIAAGDTVNVSLSWSTEGGPNFAYVTADLSVSREDVLVAYVSEHKPPPWYTKDQAACQIVDECCAGTSHDAKAEVGGEVGVVPSRGTAEVGGLAISNLELLDLTDLGCCNYQSPFDNFPFILAAAAVPAP